MVDKYTEDCDLSKTMHVLQALQWEISAWWKSVTQTTIADCQLQARIYGPYYCPLSEAQAKEREKAQYEEVVTQVRNITNILIFLLTNIKSCDVCKTITQHESNS